MAKSSILNYLKVFVTTTQHMSNVENAGKVSKSRVNRFEFFKFEDLAEMFDLFISGLINKGAVGGESAMVLGLRLEKYEKFNFLQQHRDLLLLNDN